MGVDVYLEDQIHGRTYAGAEVGIQLSRVLAKAKAGSLLAGVDVYGDTMFNLIQLQQLELELDAVSAANLDLRPDIESLKLIIEKIARSRGYLWLSGD